MAGWKPSSTLRESWGCRGHDGTAGGRRRGGEIKARKLQTEVHKAALGQQQPTLYFSLSRMSRAEKCSQGSKTSPQKGITMHCSALQLTEEWQRKGSAQSSAIRRKTQEEIRQGPGNTFPKTFFLGCGRKLEVLSTLVQSFLRAFPLNGFSSTTWGGNPPAQSEIKPLCL